METIKDFLEFEIFRAGEYAFTTGKIISALFTVLITLLVLWIIRKALFRRKDQNKLERGNIFRIENVKSEIRKVINRKFIENNITIPFPQVDLHFKSDKTGYFTKNKPK
ncbi:MAG: hypothetical protein U9N72_00570 [Bacteroidota bacterium]|nr:hypothetical protein [Bacteroidota bacterium]